jgi:hypothetical protein
VKSILRSAAGAMVAGAAGTAALSLSYAAERRLRHHEGFLDYDDSLVPGRIVANVLHLPSVTDREAAQLGTLLRWGYGSAFGIAHRLLRRVAPEPAASVVFGSILMSATFSLFPLLGRTPPPWRWPRDVLATSIATHVAYVTAVAVVDGLLLSRAASRGSPGGLPSTAARAAEW